MKLQYIEAGEIVTTHGVRGEVKVLCWLDDPEMLCEFDRCRISGKEYAMDQVRVQKTCNLVKLQGVDTMVLSLSGVTSTRKGHHPYRSWIAHDSFIYTFIGILLA